MNNWWLLQPWCWRPLRQSSKTSCCHHRNVDGHWGHLPKNGWPFWPHCGWTSRPFSKGTQLLWMYFWWLLQPSSKQATVATTLPTAIEAIFKRNMVVMTRLSMAIKSIWVTSGRCNNVAYGHCSCLPKEHDHSNHPVNLMLRKTVAALLMLAVSLCHLVVVGCTRMIVV